MFSYVKQLFPTSKHACSKPINLFSFTEPGIYIRDSDSEDEGNAVVKRQRKEKHDDTAHCKEDEIQIKNDEEIGIALQSELDKGEDVFTNESQVILALEEKVIGTDDGTDSLYIVVRIKAKLERKLNLWKRATNKVTPEHTLRVKFIGEDGIDTGANFTPINSECVLYFYIL